MFRPASDGLTYESYLNGIEAGLFNTWDSAVRTGYLTGRPTKQIVSDVIGGLSPETKLKNPGLINPLRNSIYGNTRTLLQSFAEETRERVYKENEDYFGDGTKNGPKYEYLATLDSRTCVVCGSVDGKLYKSIEDAPEIPQHRNCRCLLIPYFDIDGDVRANEDGYVSSKMTFQKWLEEQDDDTQLDVLGRTRYEMFKNGKPISQFVDNGKILTIDELGQSLEKKSPSESAMLIKDTKDFLVKNGVKPVDYEMYKVIPAEEELIEKICAKDNENMACTSLAFAYSANISGYDVNDNRGGMSEKIFRQPDTIVNISGLKGVKSYRKQSDNQVKDTLDVMTKAKPDKDYILCAGKHTALVRKDKDGLFQYLELQAKDKYGWIPLKEGHVKALFGLKENVMSKKMVTMPSILIDVKSLMKNEDFLDLLKYINKGS